MAKTKARGVRRVLRNLVIALVLIAVLGVVGIRTYDSMKQQYTVVYEPYQASTGSISNSLSFSGNAALVKSETVTASAAGEVRSILVQAGDTVQKDDKLIRLSGGVTVSAGIDGRVNSLSVEVGDTVAAGDTLAQVADFSRMQVSFRVDEYDISSVAVGQKATVTATATGDAFDAAIDTINYISSSSGSVAYYTATAKIDVPEGTNFYPGMQVTVTIPKEEATNVVVLKMDAISFDMNNSAFVYTKAEDGTMTETPVTVGVSNGNYVEIKSGVTAGDTVYAQSKAETESVATSLFGSLFGGPQVMDQRPMMSNQPFGNGGTDREFPGSSGDGGGMPAMPNQGGGQ